MAKVTLDALPEVKLLEDITRESAARVIEQLSAYKGRKVALSIFSNGGSAHGGSAVASYIANPANDMHVEARVYGNAASAAMMICAACQKAYISEGAFAMIHEAYAMDENGERVPDDKLSAEDRATLQAMNTAQAKLFASRTGKTVDEIARILKDGSDLSAEKAVRMKLFDGVIAQEQRLAAMKTMNETNMSDTTKRKLVIGHKALLAAALTSDGHIEVDEKEFTISEADKLKELEAKKAELETEIAALRAKADTVPTLETAKADAETKLVAMTTENEKHKAQLEALKKNPLVAAVLVSGNEAVIPQATPSEDKKADLSPRAQYAASDMNILAEAKKRMYGGEQAKA